MNITTEAAMNLIETIANFDGSLASIQHALEDGEALASLGVTADDLGAVEEAHSIVREWVAAGHASCPFVYINGACVHIGTAANLMDDEIRETLHSQGEWKSHQAFVDAYITAHAEKFNGEQFTVA